MTRFYPNPDDTGKGTLSDRLEILHDAAMQYRAAVMQVVSPGEMSAEDIAKKRLTPKELNAAYYWDEIARVMRTVRELPEGDKKQKLQKAELLSKLAEVYEVLRSAKMPKLEAVRLALIGEANQLRGSAAQVA